MDRFNLEEGGELTLYMTGNHDKLPSGRPRRTPIFSGENLSKGKHANREIYESNSVINLSRDIQKIGYIELVREAINFRYGPYKLVSQTICNGVFCGIFQKDSVHSYKILLFFKPEKLDDVIKIANKYKTENYGVLSLAADSNRMYMIMSPADWEQRIEVFEDIDELENLDLQGYRISTCISQDSRYLVVLTVSTLKKKDKYIFIAGSFEEAIALILYQNKSGKIVTNICYNRGKMEYLVVMESSANRQILEFFEIDEEWKRNRRLEEIISSGYYPTLVFQTPAEPYSVLIVLSSNKNGDEFCLRMNCEFI